MPPRSNDPTQSARTSRRRRLVLAGLAAGVIVLALVAARAWRPAEPARRPSIVFLLVDTLRADALGAYGFQGPVSPRLDALAEESVLFERAFSQAPWTKPSIASLLTSLQPDTHRVLSHRGQYGDREQAAGETTEVLPADAVTLAEALRDAGYATAAFVANPWLLVEHGFGQGFDVFDARPLLGKPPVATVLLRRARRWLARRDPERPFFLYLHFMDVHGPYDAPDADYEAVRASPGLPASRTLTAAETAGLPPYLLRARWAADPGADDLRTWHARYAAGVHALDRQLGPFLDRLEASGVLDDAIVVLTSDHGEELLEHGGWDHGHRLYDEQIRVPLLIRLPRGASGGRRVDEVVSLVDLMPTLLARAGAPAPPPTQGRDLSPLLEGADSAGPGTTFAGAVKWNPEMRSVRTAAAKLIRDGRAGAAQAFDLTRDPGEQHDVAREEPQLVAELEASLAEHRRALAAQPALAPEQVEISGETRERLEALGYTR
ncbi:MAG: sulfatase [Thermodesulfobacteriota bacterium]